MPEYALCPCCHGNGTKTLHGYAITSDEMEELGPEFMEDYQNGVYDTECPCCHGRRVATRDEIEEWEARVEDQRMADRESGVYPPL